MKAVWLMMMPGRVLVLKNLTERRWWFTRAGPPCNKGEFGANLCGLSVVLGYERAE